MKQSANLSPATAERRKFIKTALGLGIGLPVLGPSFANAAKACCSKPLFTRMGVNARLTQANEVHQAGGDYLLISVNAFLRPNQPEAAFEEQLRLLEQSPIPVLSCNGFLRGDALRCVGPNAKTDNVLRFAETTFRRAKRAGVKYIVFGSGGSRRRPDDWSKAQVDEQFISLLKRMGPLAGEQGVTVAVENLQERACNYLSRLSEVGEIIEAVDHPNVRMLADLYHASGMEDPAKDLERYGHVVAVVEIAEKDGRTAPGVNGQDFTHYFNALKKSGFQGPIEIEGKWNLKQLANAFKVIRQQSA